MPIESKPITTATTAPTRPQIRRPRPPVPRPPAREILFWSATQPAVDPHYFEDIFGVLPRTGVVRRLTDDDASDRDPDWSPTRRRIVSAGGIIPGLNIRDTSGAVVRTITNGGGQPVWLDRSHILACVSPSDRADIECFGLTGTVKKVTAALPDEWFFSPVWHPTAGLLVSLGHLEVSPPTTLGRILHMSASAVATALSTGVPIPASAMTFVATTTSSNSSGMAWSPDGSKIAYVTMRPCATSQTGYPVDQLDIDILDLASGHIRRVTDDSAETYEVGVNDDAPAFSPDGEWLAWCRGYEDGWSQIMLEKLSDPSTRRVLVGGTDRYRAGLSW